MVEAEEGGKRLIVVRDDGMGMSSEDARLAFQHHATSKIQSFKDLSHLQTLGFVAKPYLRLPPFLDSACGRLNGARPRL